MERQVLVAGQAPLIIYFAARWLPPATTRALVVVALHMAVIALVAIAPLWALGGL